MSAADGSLRVRLLGGLVVEGIPDTALGSRKARTLLKLLALARGSPVPVGTIADVLWGDDLPTRPADQVGVLVSRLRKALGAHRLTRRDGGLALVADWIDVDELAARVEQSADALRARRTGAARAAAGAALALARGPLLPDDDGDWVSAERRHCDALLARARSLAAEAALAAGDLVAAELAAESALAADPYDEVVLRVLMRAQAAAGRPAAALAAYGRVRARLAEDLGVSPDPDTRALHAEVLNAPAAAAVAVRADSHPDSHPLVGRDGELAVLEEHLAAVARGHVELVVIEGEAGIGKSALVEHFARLVRERGVRVLTAHADELGRDLPLQPLLDALDPASVELPGAGPLDAATNVPDAAAERVAWSGALLAAMGDTTGMTPTLLVVDDAHLADSATRDWLAWACGHEQPLLAVATARPGHTVTAGHTLMLGPLDAAAVSELIGAFVDRGRHHDVHERSGGNPLLALAIATAPADTLPATVHDAVTAILGQLGPAVTGVLRAAAVLGPDVDVDLAAAVLRTPAATIIEPLEVATRAGLLIERGAGFSFRHRVIREALEAGTGPARRAMLHRDAARALDQRPGRDPLGVAVHARLGGAADIAGQAFAEAAAVSFGRADLDAAERQLRASLHAAESAMAQQSLARVLMVAQRFDDAATAAARAVAIGADPSALEVAGWVAYYRRDYDSALRYADEAAARADEGSAVHASALTLGGRVRHGTGDLIGAEQRLTGALTGPPAVRGVGEVWLAQVRVHEGRPADALALVDHALIDPEHLAHPFAGLHGRLCRVMAFGQLGRIGAALRACDDFDAAVDRAGAVGVRFPAIAMNARAWVLRAAGQLDAADELNTAALERNGAADGSGPASVALAEGYWVALLDLVEGRLAADDHAGADALLSSRLAGLDSWQGTMAWHQRHRLGLQRARVARVAGDTERSAELATAVRDDADARRARRYAALAHAQVHLATGEGDPAAIEAVIDTLQASAALEGWSITAELGRRFGVDEWCRRASAWAARVAASADDTLTRWR